MAISVEASGHGGIILLEWTQNALGDLDTATGTVNLCPIPGAIHPVGIARDAWSGIWFVDREADVIGYLDRDANTYYLYDLPSDSSPAAIVPGQDGFDLWFVAEHGDYVGKLGVVRGP